MLLIIVKVVKAQSDKPRQGIDERVYADTPVCCNCFERIKPVTRRLPVDTPKVKNDGGLIIYTKRELYSSLTIGYHGIIISDSTGIVAARDTTGKWKVLDCGRALDAMYKFLKIKTSK